MTQPHTNWHGATTEIHAGYEPNGPYRPLAVPVYQTAAYEFGSHAEAIEKFALRELGFTYTRTGNPTTAALEARAAALEGGAQAVATATGNAAVALSLLALTQGAKHFVASNKLYGGTVDLFTDSFNDFGIRVTFVDPEDLDAWAAAIEDDTRAFFVESVSNPLSTLVDVAGLAEIAHAHGIPLVVDNTLPTPANFRPIEHGADIVVHSATKSLAGHGQVLGGLVIDSGEFDFSDATRWPQIAAPRPRYGQFSLLERYGKAAYAMLVRSKFLHDLGPTLSPASASGILTGIETLSARTERVQRSLLQIAEAVSGHQLVHRVHHPSQPDHQDFAIAPKLFPRGTGCVLAVELTDAELVTPVIDALKLFTLAANIGDVRSMVVHPATMTHCRLNAEQLAAAGLSGATLRFSIGQEDAQDLIADLFQALDTAAAQAAANTTAAPEGAFA